jgi:hypothetical protein
MHLLESVEGLPSQGQRMVELSKLATWKILLVTVTGNMVTLRQMLLCMSNKTEEHMIYGELVVTGECVML